MNQDICEGALLPEPQRLSGIGWDTGKGGAVTVEVECRDGEVVYIGPPRSTTPPLAQKILK